MARKPRTFPGMVTVVSSRLRIVNGNVESLHRAKKPGRPRKNEPIPGTPEYPGREQLADGTLRGMFWPTRRNEDNKKWNSLYAQFDALASMVREYHAEKLPANSQLVSIGSFSRIERPIPTSFCSCSEQWEQDFLPCIIHRPRKGLNSQWIYR